MIKLGTEELEYISLFEGMTKAHVKDIIVKDQEIIVIVKEGDMGLAIGRGGEVIKAVRDKVGKNVSVIEHSDDLPTFIKHLFAPAIVDSIEIDGTVARITAKENKRIVGSGGKRIGRAKEILKRHSSITDVVVN